MKYAAALALAAVLWLLAAYADTVQAMVSIWMRSETFAHGFMIVPITAWLIWRRRHTLAALDARPNLLVLPLLAVAGLGWLLGRLAGAGVVQQYALVTMIPLVVWTILGGQVVRMLAFPLFFLYFAVPFGEFLVPPLMEHTADFTVAALRLSGIPVFREEGLFFTIPSGRWSVVEACSGLRYLIASMTLGFLYAYLTYRSFSRRAIFVVFSVIVPVIANWLRAYMIVMIGHLSGMKYAVGVDHLIYGWVFFGLVMLVLFWAGSFWREDLDPVPPAATPVRRDPPARATLAAAGIAAAVMVGVWPAAAFQMESVGSHAEPALYAPAPAAGWEPFAKSLTDWTPRFAVPRAQINEAYSKGAARAAIHIGYYRDQRKGGELVTSQNLLVHEGNREWLSAGERPRTLLLNRQEISSVEAKLQGRFAALLVWRWYWVDGEYTANPYRAKLLQAKSRLLGRGDDGAVIILYTPYGDRPQDAAQVLQDFGSAMLPSITRSLEHARRIPPVP